MTTAAGRTCSALDRNIHAGRAASQVLTGLLQQQTGAVCML